MSLLNYFDEATLRSLLRVSNYWSLHNRNEYPMKIENAINELYDWRDCPCDDNCKCKQYKCKKHLVRKNNLECNNYYDHFLNCYVDQLAHNAIRNRREKGRGKYAVKAIDWIFENWDNTFSLISDKSLLCNDWCMPQYEEFSTFKPGPKTIYKSKWMALLALNVYVAYDTGSLSLLMRDYNKPRTYFDLMKRIRNDLISHLNENKIKPISKFQSYDNPNEFYPRIEEGSLRPIGNIIDKMYLTL